MKERGREGGREKKKITTRIKHGNKAKHPYTESNLQMSLLNNGPRLKLRAFT